MESRAIQDRERIVWARGEIDLGNVDGFQAELEAAVQESSHGFVIDLSGATYMDSAGMQAILWAYRSVLDTGGRLALVITHPNVKELFVIIGADRLPDFSICDDVQSAVRSLA
jgi:anti-anti-sigma factor